MGIGASPSPLLLGQSGAWLTLINPENHRINYHLDGGQARLSRDHGIIEPHDHIRIHIDADDDGVIEISTKEELPGLFIQPRLRIPLRAYRVPVHQGLWVMVTVALGGITLISSLLLFSRRLSCSSSGWNKPS